MSDPEVSTDAAACYRHPDRPALTRCSRCERPICGDDLIEAPVGYQCPECAKGGQPVRRLRDLEVAQVTRVLVGALVVAFVATLGTARSPVAEVAWLTTIQVGHGEVWRLVTSGFVHSGVIHIGFNGYLLWLLGHQLEPRMGRARFITLYVGGLIGGSLGVIALSAMWVFTGLNEVPVIGSILTTHPLRPTVGASGAVFGLFGAAMVAYRQRGIDPWRTDIGSLVLLNLVITIAFSSFISVGGHLGGLAGGALIGAILLRDRDRSSLRLAIGAVVALTAVAIVLARITVTAL
ncbi:rhomboid family intramembrane serine protease [Nitriliruptor alkaliphilus]|uniref:rhomboid family intramembrane serine protease n=1 Tax=Nitriliruptor alkaliphilus TaxID=427918 RepID=UPI000695D92D|nr:rhomboid family intramembrane serine protease [Nitriliruptor alkaliphilus]